MTHNLLGGISTPKTCGEVSHPGIEVKVTEDGEGLICSPCKGINKEYDPELKDPANQHLKNKLEAAKAIPDSDRVAKAETVAKVRDKLQ